ncbi:MAG: hypothetical protein Q3959_03720 [Limosilactobacillus sp.]|uniref:hypothetical protein n=1 Tax=Limosilactobacillus sp. TaxID=2773925 RepID=UPI0027015A94|nr:hypothetical protein [Limosilactobacillus sp.]
MTLLHFTFGSEPILRSIMGKHPDRQLQLYQASNFSSKIMLFDFSGGKSIFAAPVTLDILAHTNGREYRGVMLYQSFEVNADKQDYLLSSVKKALTSLPANSNAGLMSCLKDRKKSSTIVLISFWNDLKSIGEWKESSDYSPLLPFIDKSPDHDYFEELYNPIR